MKVTMGIIDKCGVRGDATLCVVIFYFIFILFLVDTLSNNDLSL